MFVRIHEKNHTKKSFRKELKKWTGWKPTTEDQSAHFKKEVKKNVGNKEEDLSTAQKNMENAAKKIRNRMKAQREKEMMSTPETVRLREEVDARCTTKIKRSVLRRQARKVRAEHLVKCSLEPGKKKGEKKAADRIIRKRVFIFPKTRRNGKKNFKGTVTM